MKSKLTGSVAELAVAIDLIEQGYPVFREISDASKVDLIALIDNRPVKIQVKSSKEMNEPVCCLALVKTGPAGAYAYTKDDCDVFALYNPDRKQISYIGWNDIGERKWFYIRYEPSKKPDHRSNDYKDFERIERCVNFK